MGAYETKKFRNVFAELGYDEKEINEKLGITIVLITHEMDVVKEICNRMAIMQDGRVIEEGEVYDIFASPREQLTQEFIQRFCRFLVSMVSVVTVLLQMKLHQHLQLA